MIDIWWAGFVGGFLWGWVFALCVLMVVGAVSEWRRRRHERTARRG